MKYDIEADWILLQTCNFRCSYCFFPPEPLGAKIRKYATPRQWAEGFKATGKTWLLHITGGEPSSYPEFVELCHQLSQDHYLSINSNLSHPCVKVFAERINPERVHFINAAIHYEVRAKKRMFGSFVEHVHTLQEAKFNVLPSIVMTPDVLDNFMEISERLELEGLYAIPKILRGTYKGKCYPTSYSFEEKHLIHKYILNRRQQYAGILNNMDEAPTINMFSDDIFLNGIKDYRGSWCSAGKKFVNINFNGMVNRCGPSEILGNILFKDVTFFKTPQICDTLYCPYFCEKYSIPLGNHISGNKRIKPIPNSYNRLKRKLLNHYYLIRTDGYADFINKIVQKLKRYFRTN